MEEETKKESGNAAGNTKTYIILGVVVLILVVIAGALLLSGHKTPNSSRQLSNVPTNQNQTQNQPAGTGASKQLFKDSPEYQYAYQIFPGTMSAQAKTAMSGFSMKTTTLADGSTRVSLTSTNPNYKNQSYTVKKGYSLYFVERNTVDDNPSQDSDRLYLDDSAVIVDPNGYIAQ